jgi:transcriptional regulator with XRE-family HTH domain
MVANNQFRKPSKAVLEILAGNMRDYRRAKNLSQEEFAEECGLHRTFIGAIERCERNVTLSTLEAIATAMQVQIWDMFNAKEHASRSKQNGKLGIKK